MVKIHTVTLPFKVPYPKQHPLRIRKDGRGVSRERESERSAGKIQPETTCEPEVAAVLGDPPKKRGNLCKRTSFRKTTKEQRPIGHIDVFRVGMDGTECAITGGSSVDSY